MPTLEDPQILDVLCVTLWKFQCEWALIKYWLLLAPTLFFVVSLALFQEVAPSPPPFTLLEPSSVWKRPVVHSERHLPFEEWLTRLGIVLVWTKGMKTLFGFEALDYQTKLGQKSDHIWTGRPSPLHRPCPIFARREKKRVLRTHKNWICNPPREGGTSVTSFQVPQFVGLLLWHSSDHSWQYKLGSILNRTL